MISREEKNRRQKEYRQRTQNTCTKKYEKKVLGFLMRAYRNMKSRISGVQKLKFHLYENKELLDKQEFYDWALGSAQFYKLFGDYRASNFQRKLAPSVDRVDSSKGYHLENMEWVTMQENSRRGARSRYTSCENTHV